MAEEYLKLLDEARKMFARGEDASALIPKITEALAKMTKEAREAALKSPGLSPEEANTELGALWEQATLAWIVETAVAVIAACVPFTQLGTVATKAFDAPELKWRVDAAMQGIALKTDARLLAPLRRYYNKEYLPAVVDTRSDLQLRRLGVIDDAEYAGRMGEWGFSNDEADKFLLANRTLPGVSERMRMMWRGLLTADQVKGGIQVLGYGPTDAENMFAIQEPIPGSGDLINFVVKEAFPLAALPDAPAEFKTWMARQGYADQWSRAYWFSHWRLVPEGTILDLWHRGYITADEATKYLVLHDFPTFARPGMSKTDANMVLENSYSLLPRIDLRFGWFTGTLTEDEIKALYAKYGFRAEDAAKEVEIQKARVLEIYRRGYLSTLQLAYRRGKVTADAFRSRVMAEKFPAGVADWIIKSEDLRISLGTGVEASNEERALTPSTLTRLYRRGIIDATRLRSELKTWNYSDAEVDLLVKDADYIVTEAEPKTLKDLSWTDLETLYKRGYFKAPDVYTVSDRLGYRRDVANQRLIVWDKEVAERASVPATGSEIIDSYETGLNSEAWAAGLLKEAGWSEAKIGIVLGVVKHRIDEKQPKPAPAPTPEPPRTITASEALEAFERGLKDEAWTRSQLLAQNYAAARIDLLVDDVKKKIAQAAAPTKILSLSDLEFLYKHGIWSEGDVVKQTVARGWVPADAAIIMDIWKKELAELRAPQPTKPRELSLGELQFAWENGLITDTSLSTRVAAMGYSPEDAALMTRLTRARALENERNRLLSITESRFKVGLGTEAEARALMASLGYIPERQDIIVGAWAMERDLGIVTDTRDAWLKAYAKGQSRESVRGYLTEVLKLNGDVVDALLLLEDAKLLKA